MQRNHGGESGGNARHFVGQSDRWEEWLTLGLTGEGDQPRHCLGDGREASAGGIRPILAKPGHPGNDQLRVASEQDIWPEAKPLERSGTRVLDEYVGLVEEPQQGGAVGVIFHIEHGGPLVAVDQLPPQALAIAWVTPRHVAQAVAARPLDFDHVGAEVGEVARTVGTGQHRRHVDDSQVGQWTGPFAGWSTHGVQLAIAAHASSRSGGSPA